ncbi:YciI family protein [Nocardia sp. CA-151230]|uniref:YciI family protein n=1 Tax=Nocardia sp. CA-151230 TaxID=3239982 RepID=UPI003D89B3C6
MRYLLLISADESRVDDVVDEDGLREFRAWLDDLLARGILTAHEGLHPSHTATTVRVRGDEVLLTDGPFIEAKDQIGGFALIEVADLDAAIEVAAGHPASRFGQIEIRPVRTP